MTLLLDTHILVWWSINSPRLSVKHRDVIAKGEPDGLSVSVFSFWEVAVAASKGRIDLRDPVQAWMDRVLTIPTLRVLPVTPQVALDSTTLPGNFHADPADRLIVATARAYGFALLTADHLILAYPHARTIGPD